MKFSLGAIALTALGITGFFAGDSSLKNHFKNAFLIGAALNTSEMEERNPGGNFPDFSTVQFHHTGKCHEM